MKSMHFTTRSFNVRNKGSFRKNRDQRSEEASPTSPSPAPVAMSRCLPTTRRSSALSSVRCRKNLCFRDWTSPNRSGGNGNRTVTVPRSGGKTPNVKDDSHSPELRHYSGWHRRIAQDRPLCCRPECEFHYDRHVLGNWAQNRRTRSSGEEAGRLRRFAHQKIGNGPIDLVWPRLRSTQSRQMRSFYLAWPEGKILQTPSAKSPPLAPSDATRAQSSAIQALAKQFRLPWSAYVRLLSVKNPRARAFYETEAQRSGWSVRQLDRQIDSQF
jgi:hypothetical protein